MFVDRSGILCIISNLKTLCGYSLETTLRGTPNEYPNISFYGELEKIIPEIPKSISPLRQVLTKSSATHIHIHVYN